MSVTPAGILSLPLDLLRTTLAGSATFQSLVGAEDASAALTFIHAVSAPGRSAPPFAVLDWGRFDRVRDAVDARSWYMSEGDLHLILRGAIQDTDDADAGYRFCNSLGSIIAEMEALAGTAGYLDITEIRLDSLDRPLEQEAESAGDYYQAVFTIAYEDRAQ